MGTHVHADGVRNVVVVVVVPTVQLRDLCRQPITGMHRILAVMSLWT